MGFHPSDEDLSLGAPEFTGLNLDEKVWDATTFTKNRDRLLEGSVAKDFLAQVVERAREAGLVFRRTFHRRRHAAGSLGEPEKFSAARTQDGRAAR